MAKNPSFHKISSRIVREVVSLGLKEAAERTGLSRRALRAISEGKRQKINHETYNAFRRAHYSKAVDILTSHNVTRSAARKEAHRKIDFNIAAKTGEFTDYGLTLDEANNEARNFYARREKVKYDTLSPRLKSIMDEEQKEFEEKLARDYDRMARKIVDNNDFAKHWKAEGKRFLNDPARRVRTHEDAVDMMKQVMSVIERGKDDWDRYIKERTKEKWQPAEYKYSRRSKKYVRKLLNDPENPKYIDWQRRRKTR